MAMIFIRRLSNRALFNPKNWSLQSSYADRIVRTKHTINSPFIFKDQSNILEDGVRSSKSAIGSQEHITACHLGMKTLHDSFQRGLGISRDEPFLGRKNLPTAPYEWITYNEANSRIKAFGDGLVQLGLEPGNNTFVAILSQNRPKYMIADQGLQRHSMVQVPMYNNLHTKNVKFILNQADIKTVICDNDAKAKKILRMPDTPVETIIVMDQVFETTMDEARARGVKIFQFEEVERLGQQKEIKPTLPTPDDLYMLCYTSGTTGVPKGAKLTHNNIVILLSAVTLQLEYNNGMEWTPNEVLISYLPLAHIFEKLVENAIMTYGARIGYFQGDVSKLFDDFKELEPTVFPTVPRVLNRINDKISLKVNSNAILKTLFNIAIKRKEGKISQSTFWDKVMLNKIQALLGTRLRLIICGSAPLDPDVLTLLRCVFGVPILEGYGQTESTGVSNLQLIGDWTAGNVGPPIAANMIKLIDLEEMNYFVKNNQGEVCVKGPNVFDGYYKADEKTAEILDEDGWLKTGDVAEWQHNGTLKIIDRKKSLFKLSNGIFVAPEKIENVLIQNSYVGQAFVHGNSKMDCLVAVVVPDKETVSTLAAKLGVPGSYEDLIQSYKIKEAICSSLQDTADKARLNNIEMVKDVCLVSEEFTVENGLITPTFKLKRDALRQRYNDELELMEENVRQGFNLINYISPF